MNLSEDIERIKEVMGIGKKPEVVSKGEFTNKYGEEITIALFDDGEVYLKHSDYGNEFLPLKSLIRKDIEGNSSFMIVLHQEEKDFVNNFLRDTKYQNESYNPIITESRDMFFRRRQDEFLDVLLHSFEWMDEFIDDIDSFEDYLKFTLGHSIDAFFEFNHILVKRDEIEELLPLALSSLHNDERLFRKIKDHYYSKKSDTTITESIDRFLTRRELEFNKYIRNHFGNVNPRKFDTFENYLDYVLQYAIMIFFSNVTDHSDLKRKDMEELAPIALHHLKQDQDLYDKIKNEYYNIPLTVNESHTNFFKRRQKSFISNLYRILEMFPAFGYESLEEYVDQIVIETLAKTYREENFQFPDRFKEDPLFPIIKQVLLNNEELFFLVKNKFKSYNPFKSTRMNESVEITKSQVVARIKRRMDVFLEYIEDTYNWLSPRRFDNFDHFLQRVVFSALRDFIAEEIGGEFEDQSNISDELEPKVLELIKQHWIYDDIYDHYIANT
jgi:hypothetical protein